MEPERSRSHHAVLHVDFVLFVRLVDLDEGQSPAGLCHHIRYGPETLQAGKSGIDHLQLHLWKPCKLPVLTLEAALGHRGEPERNQTGCWVYPLICSSPDRCCVAGEKSVRLSVWLSDWCGKCPSVSLLSFYRHSLKGRRLGTRERLRKAGQPRNTPVPPCCFQPTASIYKSLMLEMLHCFSEIWNMWKVQRWCIWMCLL